MKRLFLALLAAVTLLGTVRAQTPPIVNGKPPGMQQLSEVEKLKIENIQLKFTQLSQEMQAAQQKQQELRTQFTELVGEIEKEHPGFTVGGNGSAELVPKPITPPATPMKEVKPEAKK
jgi:hypothetical protein